MVQVNVTDELAAGDTIVTAGLVLGSDVARSAYPRGLLIGHVADVEQDPNALTQTGFVRPALDFSRLDRLLVITGFEQD